MTMSFFSRNKKKQRVPEWTYGFSYYIPSAEAPRIHFSPKTVERIAREHAEAARAAAQGGHATA